MPQETYTLTLSMHSLQTIVAVSTILFLTLITRAVLGSISTRGPDLWPEPLRKTWVKWTVSIIGALFFVALIAAFAVVYDTVRNVFIPPTSGSSSPNLGAGALIAALLGAPFVIWGTYIKFQALGFQREGHITDRISKAVEQLGAEKTVKRVDTRGLSVEETVPNIEVRIGGLLSIERIAQDSVKYDKGRDHVRMMEILCAYVRNNAPASGAVEMPREATRRIKERASKTETTKYLSDIFTDRKTALDWSEGLPKQRADIQLALRIIGRRSVKQRRYESEWGQNTSQFQEIHAQETSNRREQQTYVIGYKPDLRDTNLQAADLSGLALSGIDFRNAHMQGANLTRAWLQGADLQNAQMQCAMLLEACAQGALLHSAKLRHANCREVMMQAADMSWADLSTADFDNATLEKANFAFAKMLGTSMISAELRGAALRNANICGADLSEVDLRQADLGMAHMLGTCLIASRLEGANLEGAKMQNSDLHRVTFDEKTILRNVALEGVVLSEVDLTNVAITQKQIDLMFADGSVALPQDVLRPKHWPQDILPGEAFEIERDKWRDSRET